jgi:hypothetical protein
MEIRTRLLRDIEAFLTRSGMSARQFGVAAVKDSMFIPRLRRGFGVTLTTIEKAEAFIRERSANDNGPAAPSPAGAAQSAPQEISA